MTTEIENAVCGVLIDALKTALEDIRDGKPAEIE